MTSDTSDHDSDHDEPDPIEWEAEQNEMAIRLSAADLWDDYCIRRLDPCDPAYWDDEPDRPAD